MKKGRGEIDGILPLIGVLVISAQRLLPILQNIYASLMSINGGKKSASTAIDYLEQKAKTKLILNDLISGEVLNLKSYLSLENVYFRYEKTGSYIFEGLNFKINKGDKVGIIGSTGEGKSTFLDLMMGLLRPEAGVMKVDGIEIEGVKLDLYHSLLAHVPLADTTIAKNISFRSQKELISKDDIEEAAKIAQIHDYIVSLPNGYETIIGEHGVRLSGGQRQRIGIARAIYKKPQIMILDEATSALDIKTEAKLVQALDERLRGITLVMVAHRHASLKNCNVIYEITKKQAVVKTVLD